MKRDDRALIAAILIAPITLMGCARETPAYVINPDRADPSYVARYQANYEAPYTDEHPDATITVRDGDDLWQIASRCHTTVEDIKRLNDLDDVRAIYPGESLRVPLRDCDRLSDVPRPEPRPHRDWIAREGLPDVVPQPRPNRDDPPPRDDPSNQAWEHTLWSWWTDGSVEKEADGSSRFIWPVRGPIIDSFGRGPHGERNDGINIAAEEGTPIRAAAAGVVTYRGNELRDYGNLVLIKHDGGYVTAYAHAGSIRVQLGEHVTKGQVIATTGETGDVDRPQLHFEIRRGVQPVDPARFLANRAS